MVRMKMPENVGTRERKYVERTTGEKSFLQSSESGATLGKSQAKKHAFAKLGKSGNIAVSHHSVSPKFK